MDNAIPWQRIEVNTEAVEGRERFPLPLTVMERFLIWDDSRQYPKRFQIVMQFDGSFNEEAWKAAMLLTLVRHPMLLARVESYDQRWVMPSKGEYELAIVDELHVTSRFNLAIAATQPLAALISKTIATHKFTDPTHTPPPLRVLVVTSSEQTYLAFDAFHANTDGLGMRHFIEDITNSYETLAESAPERLRWRKLDPARLMERGACPSPRRDQDARPTSLWEKLVHAFHFHVLGPQAIFSRRRAVDKLPDETLEFRCCDIELEGVRGLRTAFLDHSVNINEWAITSLLELCNRWKKESGSRRHRLRVSIPIDMRVRDDVRLSAANKIGFAFIVANEQTAMGGQRLLVYVREQLEMIRTLCLGNDFVNLFQFAKNIGGIVRLVLRNSKCFATAVVTNLGDVTARQRRGRYDSLGRSTVGDLKLRAIFGWPPIRKGTQVGVGLCRYNHRLSVACVFDRSVFTQAEVDAFFTEYLTLLQTFPTRFADEPEVA